MKTYAILGALALITSSASAQNGFTGFTIVRTITAAGNTQYKISGNWSTASSFTILNAFDFNVAPGASGTMNARHQDAAEDAEGNPTQSWSANWNLLGTTARDNDSWVTMSGLGTSSGNDASLDPSFYPGDGQSFIPVGGGWFDSTPGTQNLVGTTLKCRVLQIARLSTNTSVFTANMTLGYAAFGATTPLSGYGSFTIPAPGAMALLGLAGAFGRRRRI